MTLLSVIIKSKFIKMYKNKKLNLDTLNKKISGEIEDPDNTSSIIPISESPDESQNSSPQYCNEASPRKLIKVKPYEGNQIHKEGSEQDEIEEESEYKKNNDKKETIQTSIEETSQSSIIKMKKIQNTEQMNNKPKLFFDIKLSQESNPQSKEGSQEIKLQKNEEKHEQNMEEISEQQSQEDEEQEYDHRKAKLKFKTFLVQNLKDLIFSTIPPHCTINCVVVCREQFFSMDSTFDLFLVNQKKKILTAYKSKIQLKSNYEIRELQKNQVVGTVKSNFTGTQFIVSNNSKRELTWIGYNTNFFGFSAQRSLFVLKNPNKNLEQVPHFSQIKTFYENGMKNKFSKFYSKLAEKRSDEYELNFHGKITQPSMRNFILDDQFQQECLLFGKREKDIYYMEIGHPFTIVEAFGIALSNLDKKILVR